MRLAALLLVVASTSVAAPPPRTFRIDYFHTGSGGKEIFSLDRLVIEPLPWPGNPARPIDDTDSGKYRFLVRDATSKSLLYSRGFSSIFGEWEDTQDAKERARTFEESFRFPLPAGPVEVTLEKRDRANAFVPLWTFKVDPKDQTVSDAAPDSPGALIPLLRSGPPESKVDLLILGDGYTRAQRSKFEKDARRLVTILFSTSPFKERRQDFNVWGLCPESREPGISRPSTGIHRRSRIGATYDAFGSERYILTFDNR
ncbi:MAG TPA: M64 family metallopeptidase, partial [Myxococcaceae bacterium]|nr:M64 family metallopeptidase [Myxococcaceae bacterium]